MGVPDQENCHEGREADEIEDGRLVENQVIVQSRQCEHQDETDHQPAHLLHVHAGEAAAVRGGINLNHAEGADGRQDGQEPPVVVACSGCVFHRKLNSLVVPKRSTMERILNDKQKFLLSNKNSTVALPCSTHAWSYPPASVRPAAQSQPREQAPSSAYRSGSRS